MILTIITTIISEDCNQNTEISTLNIFSFVPAARLSSFAVPRWLDVSKSSLKDSALFIVSKGALGCNWVIMETMSWRVGEDNTDVRNHDVTSSVIHGFEEEGGHATAIIRKDGCTEYILLLVWPVVWSLLSLLVMLSSVLSLLIVAVDVNRVPSNSSISRSTTIQQWKKSVFIIRKI